LYVLFHSAGVKKNIQKKNLWVAQQPLETSAIPQSSYYQGSLAQPAKRAKKVRPVGFITAL
jgi:hypothetical protein